MQVQLILPQLADAGASLWCPEGGGPVDPNSEAHDIVLNLFGGLSKAERRRLQTRVRAAKEQQRLHLSIRRRWPVATPGSSKRRRT